MTLKELNIGDKFYPASKAYKATPIFEVIGKPEFNSVHGRPTRKCIDLSKNIIINKSCSLEVIKTRNKEQPTLGIGELKNPNSGV